MVQLVAFLRSINIGRRRVTGSELEEVFGVAGCSNPKSFLASGNVLFSYGQPDTAELALNLESSLQDSFGFSVPVFLRTKDQLVELVRRWENQCPFSEEDCAAGKPQVMFLQQPLDPEGESALVSHTTKSDVLAPVGEQIFWLPVEGVSGSGLAVKELEKIVGLTTTRTINTVNRLVKKFE